MEIESEQQIVPYPHRIRRRTSAKRDKLAAELRRDIIGGIYLPGQQLPTRRDLLGQHGGSLDTVQKALVQLVDEGFVCARGAAGTYVADEPPHLCHYGLVFPSVSSNPTRPWPQFWKAMRDEARVVSAAGSQQVRCFYGLSQRAGDNAEYEKLLQCVRDHAVAGLIFVTGSTAFEGTSIMDEPGVPRVIMGHNAHSLLPAVNTDTESFLARALDLLAEQGRRRVALVAPPGMRTYWNDGFESAVEKRGLTTRRYWQQWVEPASLMTARNCIHAVMHAEQTVRPDAVIVADDNLVSQVEGGLFDARVRVPDEVTLVAHCNFPSLIPAVLPMHRLGFDMHEVLRACMNCIDLQRRGEPVPASTRIGAVFEHEVGVSV